MNLDQSGVEISSRKTDPDQHIHPQKYIDRPIDGQKASEEKDGHVGRAYGENNVGNGVGKEGEYIEDKPASQL